MPMGYSAGYADIISVDFILNICPVDFEMFIDAIHNEEKKIDEIAISIQCEGNIDSDKIEKAYDNLTSSFKNKTGLSLEIDHHNSDDNGSCYDEVEGVYWAVSGVWELTPAGKKYEDEITRKMFVNYG